MDYLLFVAWLVGLCWIITRIRFFTATGLTKAQLVSIFLLKAMAGIFYGWIGIYYGGLAKMQDTWSFHFLGIEEFNLLFSHPREYFTNMFSDPYQDGSMPFLSGSNSYWNDLKGNFFIKILSLFNILSAGNYYVNVLFYSAVSLVGPLAFYRVMRDVFPEKKTLVLMATFLVPSFLYWTSGLHKEGLLFTGVCLLVFAVHFSLRRQRWNARRILAALTGILLLITLRNFVLLLLLPALLAWVLAHRRPEKSALIFGTVYAVTLLLFFLLPKLDPRLDFPQAVVNRQQDFLQMAPGGSTLEVTPLEPHALSFLRNTPQALDLTVLRPNPGDVRHILSLAAAIEINVLLLLFVVFVFFHTRTRQASDVLYFSLFFAVTLLLAIGFTSNNLGAIVRYRSIIIPFLVVPMLARIDWNRLNRLFKFSY